MEGNGPVLVECSNSVHGNLVLGLRPSDWNRIKRLNPRKDQNAPIDSH